MNPLIVDQQFLFLLILIMPLFLILQSYTIKILNENGLVCLCCYGIGVSKLVCWYGYRIDISGLIILLKSYEYNMRTETY